MRRNTNGMLPMRGENKVKLFDTCDGFGEITNLRGVGDPCVIKLGDQWQMFLGAQLKNGKNAIVSASLPPGELLSSTKWSLTVGPDPHTVLPLVEQSPEEAWDAWGLHTPCFVRGWDPTLQGGTGAFQTRLYYCGRPSQSIYGPYAISFLEWSDTKWVRHASEPIFTATEPQDAKSAAEPAVCYEAGKWRIWYVTSGPDGHTSLRYAESVDGKSNWAQHTVFMPEDMNVYNNDIINRDNHFEMIVSLRGQRDGAFGLLGSGGGLRWLYAHHLSSQREGWSRDMIQIVETNDGTPWHAQGIWSPCIQYGDTDADRDIMYVFFNGAYPSDLQPPHLPWHLTVGRMQCKMMRASL